MVFGSVCLRFFNVYGPKQDPSSPYSGVISRFGWSHQEY
jgi:UDP-glucose 4-epimerase